MPEHYETDYAFGIYVGLPTVNTIIQAVPKHATHNENLLNTWKQCENI